jgi:DNA-binding MurR/RpiR family transcriptional regulator
MSERSNHGVQKSLTAIIKENFSTLSTGQKKVAKFFIEHPDESVLLTAFQIGRKVAVSETTVIRLAYALGFSGFSQMQELVRKEWLSSKQTEEGNPACIDANDDIFSKVIEQEGVLLRQLLQQVDTDDVWRAVDEIIAADRIYIGGFGSSHAAGYWLYYSLKQLRDNVSLSQPTGFFTEDVSDLTDKSVAVIFSFPRYRREAVSLAHLVQKQKGTVIAITNKLLSPAGQLADITFTTEEQMAPGYHSIASVITLIEIIIAGIHSRYSQVVSERHQKLEALYTEQRLFLE